MITLSIEAAIAGGSMSLIRDSVAVAHWIGSGNVSKAENLLGDIDRLLTENDIDRSQIARIAVSAGPGSFTGVRIGIATVLGLKTGLGVEMASVSALEAMVFTSGTEERVTAAVPMGRGSVCVQEFENGAAMGLPHVVAYDAVADIAGKLILHGSLAEPMSGRSNVVDAGFNLAHSVGLLAAERRTVVEPLFVSKHNPS